MVVAVVNKKQGKSGICLRMCAELRQIPDKGMQQNVIRITVIPVFHDVCIVSKLHIIFGFGPACT